MCLADFVVFHSWVFPLISVPTRRGTATSIIYCCNCESEKTVTRSAFDARLLGIKRMNPPGERSGRTVADDCIVDLNRGKGGAGGGREKCFARLEPLGNREFALDNGLPRRSRRFQNDAA